MALLFWRHNTPATGTVTTSTTTTTNTGTAANGGAIVPDALINTVTQALRNDATNTYFQLQRNRGYVDATAFGDTIRTYFNHDYYLKPAPKKPTAAHLKKIEAISEQLAEVLATYGKTTETLGVKLQRIAVEIERLEKDKAELKAELTLKEHLDADQLAQFKKTQTFLVQGKKMTYELSMTAQPKIVAGPQAGNGFCIYAQLQYGVPRADEVLGMKLFIEANEADFLKTANLNSESWIYLDPDGVLHPRGELSQPRAYEFRYAQLQADLDGIRGNLEQF